MIHFGINPVSGGSPASDRRRSAIPGRRSHDFDINDTNCLVDFEVMEFIMINSGAMMIEYRSRYMDARFGLLIVIALIIHPICVIDEYAIIDRSCVWFSPIAP